MSDDAKGRGTSDDQVGAQATSVTETWRVGRSVGRTLYVDDMLVGMVDTEAAAQRIVAAMNDGLPREAPNEDIDRLRRALGFSQSTSDTKVVNEAISRLVLTRGDRPNSDQNLTPCDRPFTDCTVCKGTGKHDGDPCPSCVWRRWYEDNRASLKAPEEIDAERAEVAHGDVRGSGASRRGDAPAVADVGGAAGPGAGPHQAGSDDASGDAGCARVGGGDPGYRVGVVDHGAQEVVDKALAQGSTSAAPWTAQETVDYLARGVLPEHLRATSATCARCGFAYGEMTVSDRERPCVGSNLGAPHDFVSAFASLVAKVDAAYGGSEMPSVLAAGSTSATGEEAYTFPGVLPDTETVMHASPELRLIPSDATNLCASEIVRSAKFWGVSPDDIPLPERVVRLAWQFDEARRDGWTARDRRPDYDQHRREGWNDELREVLAVLERKTLSEETEKDRGWNVALEEVRRAVEVRQGSESTAHGSPCEYVLGFEDAIEQCADYVGSFDLATTFRSFTCNGHGASSPKRGDGT